MEKILKLATVNEDVVEANENRIMNATTFPYRIYDIPLPQCNTGFVYMLSSIRRPTYSYIGEINCLRDRLKQHNSGYGSYSTEPSYLRPFAVMAFICGFSGEKILCRFIEQKWKEKRNF